ncbi:hypothetical protein [Fibrella aestuarina]|uniref:hypothetical protein n=1 Tax=Fibrella aestuarina TaxID=651143 RepID=UPI00130EED2C|nr:hypothetical protein [Fibrella aestuarina]
MKNNRFQSSWRLVVALPGLQSGVNRAVVQAPATVSGSLDDAENGQGRCITYFIQLS